MKYGSQLDALFLIMAAPRWLAWDSKDQADPLCALKALLRAVFFA